MEKEYTILEGNDRNNADSELSVKTLRDMLIHFWAMAKCENPVVCWHFAGLDGWESNHHMMKQDAEIPESLRDDVRSAITKENALALNTKNNRPLDITISMIKPGFFNVYCLAMRYEAVSREKNLTRDITSLYCEYQSLVEAGEIAEAA
jgi:hypothetical protein